MVYIAHETEGGEHWNAVEANPFGYSDHPKEGVSFRRLHLPLSSSYMPTDQRRERKTRCSEQSQG